MNANFGTPQEIYNALSNSVHSCGIFHKCIFHIHTPASHDYEYFKNYDEPKITDLTLFNECVKMGICPSDKKLEIFESYRKNDDWDFQEQEFWAFLLIAGTFFKNELEVIILSDHNTIAGYDKLCKAVEILYNQDYKGSQSKKFYPTVILGVELSCADKNHVVAIFDDSEKVKNENKKKIQEFLAEFLMNEDDGLYITSNEVIDTICDMGGIAYIAHINSSNMFSSKDKFMSEAYKKKLFANSHFHIAGVKDILSAKKVQLQLEKETKREFTIVLDSDAHNIEDISENHFWIKGQKCNFSMIQSALLDSKITVSLEQPKKPKIFIEGLLIRGSRGFLNDGDDTKEFSVTFSDSLNCLIGGRGTGKSTILSLIELVLAQQFHSTNFYEAINEYNKIGILCKFDDVEYLILFAPLQKIYSKDDAIKNLVEYLKMYENYCCEINDRIINQPYSHVRNVIKNVLMEKAVSVYKINSGICETSELSKKNKQDILSKIFGNGYVINDLIRKAVTGEISNYIIETLDIEKRVPKIKIVCSRNGLLNFLDKHEELLTERKKAIEQYLEVFNDQETQKNKLRIRYVQNLELHNFVNFENILEDSNEFKKSLNGSSEKYFCKYNITFDGVIGFLSQCASYGIEKFFSLVFRKKYEDLEKIVSIENFCEDFSNNMVENGFRDVHQEPDKVLKSIINEFLRLGEKAIIKKFADEYIKKLENFTLEFNIESKSTSQKNKKANFLEIKKLSQGQKVVAMLSFILGYSAFIHDERPLIIDQPEDNLDNQYIYETLVKTIRDVKLQKQIIIATHNATIVTNARAEQVIVLESDGQNGWIAASGYSDERKIKKHIINYLEGGIEAFRKKYMMYADLLKSEP